MAASYSPASSPYLRDILDQPRAVRDTVAGLATTPELLRLARALANGTLRHVVLTGMGSSLTALVPLHLRLLETGCAAVWVETSELLHHQPRWLAPDCLLLVVSQSGGSAETVALLEKNARRAPVLGVTNTAGSPLAGGSEACVLLAAGREATVACKSYTATLAALAWLGEVLTGGEAGPALAADAEAAAAMETYLAGRESHLRELEQLVHPGRMTFFVGRGTSLASALTAGLITKEATGCAAEGLSGAAFRHGPLELAGPQLQLVAFSGEPTTADLQHRLVHELVRHGSHAFVCGPAAAPGVFRIPDVPPPARPLLEILPVQLMTLALARAGGREAGHFRLASKITATE